MTQLKSPAGTVVEASDELAEVLQATGYTPVKEPAPKRARGKKAS